nr:nicotinamide riboside kinase [Cryptococcus depauperatus CBS 7855]
MALHKKKVVVIGIGGASCSGKTLLAKHLSRVLPGSSTIIHQDDLCPPAEKVPYSVQYPDLQDWDDPEYCIRWPDFRSLLRQVRETGKVGDYTSHDHLNKENKIGVDEKVFERCKQELDDLQEEQKSQSVELVWVIVDGFVLYYDKEAVDMLDIYIFLHVPYSLLKIRREQRQVYVMQHPDDAAAGGVWVDPPGYFDKIVWPGYVKAHQDVFKDLKTGELELCWGSKGRDLRVIYPAEGEEGMTQAFSKGCAAIIDGVRTRRGVILP